MKLNSEDLMFLELAIKTAGENMESGGGPFGAVIVREGSIIAHAGNRVVPGHDPTAHAEVMAIRMAAEALGTHDLGDCTIYASCEPCPMCLGAIYWAGIRRIVYASDRYRAAEAGFSDNHIYEELALDRTRRTIAMVRGLKEEGDSILKRWEEMPDKKQY
ncbi:MAG: nucleoside deaminase [Bacteroidales bacterium]|jgi:tRNA(Arg) A34 adenosine deaminase TadA|nr:nucleoside deaminase [Bacteroidales bacterium]